MKFAEGLFLLSGCTVLVCVLLLMVIPGGAGPCMDSLWPLGLLLLAALAVLGLLWSLLTFLFRWLFGQGTPASNDTGE